MTSVQTFGGDFDKPTSFPTSFKTRCFQKNWNFNGQKAVSILDQIERIRFHNMIIFSGASNIQTEFDSTWCLHCRQLLFQNEISLITVFKKNVHVKTILKYANQQKNTNLKFYSEILFVVFPRNEIVSE